eukprot:CAMPEP_0113446716 /NCGR_PEP_ID=MMETSP0014_2-20120614/3857_1 /TAXON_ID=2857 /ORGANISM="Nitzschia sp." /LENGTH=448 /DNA_ID=CAMNT_0000337831 /DNA_START=505 /DNA_END=1848 /DNA_ORIENTATION=+ /assembly_acc=CAM_ASM_000159
MMTSINESTNSTTSKTAATSTTTTTTTAKVAPVSSYDENEANDDAEVGRKNLDDDAGSNVTTSTDKSHQRLKWRWLQAAYHSIVTIIGTGILGFPYATSYLGFAGGSMMIIFATLGCFYTAHLLTDLQKPDQGTYTEVADAIMGQGFSNYGVRPFQLLNFFPTAAVMILVGGTAMFTLDGLDDNQKLDQTAWIAIMGGIVLALSLLPDLSHIWQISALGCVAAFMIVGYSIGGSSVAIAEDFETDIGRPEESTIHTMFRTMSSFGSIIFGYGFHAVLPDIQSSLHEHDSQNAHKDTKKAVTIAFSIAGPAYLIVALIGYAAFGAAVEDNILLNINDVLSSNAMYVIWVFVAVKTASEGAVFNQAAFTLIRDVSGLTVQDDHVDHHPRSWALDWIMRSLYVILATIVAIFVPFFGDLTAITGALSITPLSFILPIVLWNKEQGPKAPRW